MKFKNSPFQLDKQTYEKFVGDSMNKFNPSNNPDPSHWWFFGWGLAIGATIMGLILTVMPIFK